MNKSEVSELFKNIKFSYQTFSLPKEKDIMQAMIDHWYGYLKNVSFQQACDNLQLYASNPENNSPPHPGVLAEKIMGQHTPGAEETRQMTNIWHEDWKEKAVPMPEHVRKMVKNIGRK